MKHATGPLARSLAMQARARLRQASIDLRLMARLYVEAQHIDTDWRELEDAFSKLSQAAIEFTAATNAVLKWRRSLNR